MANHKHIIQSIKPIKSPTIELGILNKSIYYGEVISIEDDADGGRIKARIAGLDINVLDDNLPWAYPIRAKFFHAYPQKGEVVRIFLEDTKFPNKGRYWEGSIISQPHKIGYDGQLTALSTSNLARLSPEEAPTKNPEANGIYPSIEDIALVGRVNTDVILKPNEVLIRAGKHENDNPLKLNIKNPSFINLGFNINSDTKEYYSNSIVMSDKIALISHSGNPKFKSNKLTPEDKEKIFQKGHPIPRGDVLVEALNLIRKVLINHMHGYSVLPAIKDAMILELEKVDFDNILQKNIVIN